MTLEREGHTHIDRGVPSVRPPAPLTPPKADEAYYDRLAVLGITYLVAAVVGKLLLANLSPKRQA